MLSFGAKLEELSQEQFQSLVSALAVKQYPRVQCMPLRGRDGGRDVIIREHDGPGTRLRDALVIQSKSRTVSPIGNPTQDELYKWITGTIRTELHKIVQLKERGATEYIFATNVPGSGDLDTGLRDRVQQYLDENLAIRGSVWWREDIESRLRAYPEVAASHGVICGLEALRSLLQTTPENAPLIQPPTSTATAAAIDIAMKGIMAFCAEQYRDEDNVRFRQVDLDNVRVTDVFVDVPVIQIERDNNRDAQASWLRTTSLIASRLRSPSPNDEDTLTTVSEDRPRQYSRNPGLADLLLLGPSDMTARLLVEGAPGQGKSTTSQYVCQVHRMRLLETAHELDGLTRHHRYSQVRIPFRVELRRFAAWLTETEADSQAGVLGYLANLLARASEFDLATTEVARVICTSPTILMLDGLDEVADVDLRDQVINAISALASKLSVWKADAQLIVTSRPSTSQRTSILAKAGFNRVALTDLPEELINKYAESWIAVRNFGCEQADEFRDVLQAAMQTPHVADLARNPMQLAILLHLVHVRGWSMPDKRTALYDAYVDTALTREAEKDLVVRQNREILLELHGYIAWLHCMAPPCESRGSGLKRIFGWGHRAK